MKLSDCCGCPADDNYELEVCHCCNKSCSYIQEEDANKELRETLINGSDNDIDEHSELNVSEG